MSETLTRQMNDYFAYLDEEQGAIDLETIRTDGAADFVLDGTPQPAARSRRPRPRWGLLVAGGTAVVILVVGLVVLDFSPIEGSAPVATLPESTPTPAPPTTSYPLPPLLGLTIDIPDGVESGMLATPLGTARWVHLNSSEYTVPSLGWLSSNTHNGFRVDGLVQRHGTDCRKWESQPNSILTTSLVGHSWRRTVSEY
jgi:hypothetical protein